MHVLMVHPDPRAFREVRSLLEDCGATGAYQPSLDGIRYQVEAHCPDLIILERSCLNHHGDLLAEAFHPGQRLPVLFLMAVDQEAGWPHEERARLAGLLSFLRVQQERTRSPQAVGQSPVLLQVGRLRIHPGRMRVALDDRWVRLPPIQFRILQHLAAHVNDLVTHRELMDIVWGKDAAAGKTPDLLKVHIMQLRRRLGPEFRNYIQAVRGQGYVLVNPEDDSNNTTP